MVAHGKTYKTYGASNIFLTQMQHKIMQRFIHEYRPLFNPKTDQLFCKVNGHRSEVGDVGRYLQEAWTAFGTVADIEVCTNISCTLIRKSVISCASSKGFNQEQRWCMAKAMDHSVPVAERYYNHDDDGHSNIFVTKLRKEKTNPQTQPTYPRKNLITIT